MKHNRFYSENKFMKQDTNRLLRMCINKEGAVLFEYEATTIRAKILEG